MEYLEQRRSLIESRLEEILSDTTPQKMTARLEHVSLSGGKRVRPLITLLAYEAAGGDLMETPTPRDHRSKEALDFAVGIELVHNASLVVDDIIDESPVRRGVKSAWDAYGHGEAIITSDGLLGEAFSLFSANEEAMQVVAEAMIELGEGEATELVSQPSTEEEYMELARRKTGSLFRAAAEVGAIANSADPYTVESCGKYAERVGIAFQIRDDVLDATANPESLGKPTGQDLEMERPSLIRITDMAPDEANKRARAESDSALTALDRADLVESPAVDYLKQLAEFVVQRER